MGWLVFIVSGAILTAFAAAFFRANIFQLSIWEMVFVLLPTTIWTQFAFAKGFTAAPKFFVAWFIGTAVCSACALLATRLFFHESLKRLDALAIGLILIGAVILARGS